MRMTQVLAFHLNSCTEDTIDRLAEQGLADPGRVYRRLDLDGGEEEEEEEEEEEGADEEGVEASGEEGTAEE